MKHFFAALFLIVWLFFGKDLGYTAHSHFFTHISYNFQHANFWHLFINSMAFVGMFTALQPYLKGHVIVLSSLIISVLCSFAPVTQYPIPTLGASGMIYAMIGIYMAIQIRSGKQRKSIRLITLNPPSSFLLFLIMVAVSLLVSFFKPNSAFALHALCLITGAAFGTIYRK